MAVRKLKLLIPKHVFREIVSSVLETPRGFETGVTLFGTPLEGTPEARYVVLAIAGPGRKATHEPAHYSGDENHSNAVYEALASAMPAIRWIGELHVHPRGMTWLSGGDLSTVRQILTGTDETLHPDEFIAGVLQRSNGTVDIYPFHFTREWLEGRAMEILVVDSNDPEVQQARRKTIERGDRHDRPSICAESEGGRAALPETRGHHWLRQWWKRARGYDFESWHRQVHAR